VTVLITGADGQLASALHARMAAEHHVVAVTRAQLDLTNYDAVIDAVRELRPDVILNGAAYNDVDGAEDHPTVALSVNAFGVRALAGAARSVGATLVHFSTDFVFDGTTDEPYTEEIPPNPQSVYATSKLLGEWFAGEADHYVLRVESLFGGSASSQDDVRPRGSSVDRMADAILSDREVRAFDDRTVSPSFVEDVADATLALLQTRAPFGLYHCVGSGMGTWVDVVQELARHLNRSAQIIPVQMADFDMKANRPKFCALSNAKLASVGISMPTWQDALARFATARLVANSPH
jgi:dTDP-4-dehydrorhamnose reductase